MTVSGDLPFQGVVEGLLGSTPLQRGLPLELLALQLLLPGCLLVQICVLGPVPGLGLGTYALHHTCRIGFIFPKLWLPVYQIFQPVDLNGSQCVCMARV